MKIKKIMKDHKKEIPLYISDEDIISTIEKSKKSFFNSEKLRLLSYHEFLWIQFKYIHKTWWILQTLLLIILVFFLMFENNPKDIHRGLGVIASLFVIFIIPELWKNRTTNSMEIEDTSYFTLRQIYASRLMLFGIFDSFIITICCLIVSFSLKVSLITLMVHFILPLCVTTIICLYILSNKKRISEISAIFSCFFWSAIWLSIVSNEWIYTKLVLPLWFVLLLLAIIFIGILIYKVINSNNKFWEAMNDGINM